MDNLVAHHRGLREEAEKNLSVKTRDLEEAKGQLLRASSGLQAVTVELKAASSSLQNVTGELSAERNSSDGLRARLAEMETKMSEVEWELEISKSREVEMANRLASSSKEAILAEYKASDDFTMEWMDKVLPYYDQGKHHVLRMAAASGVAPLQLFQWGEAAHYSEVPRLMHHLVPFSEEELDVMRQREPEWSPPPVLGQNIPYLVEVAKYGGTVDMTPTGWKVVPADDSGEEQHQGEDATAGRREDEDVATNENDPPAADA